MRICALTLACALIAGCSPVKAVIKAPINIADAVVDTVL